MKKPYFAPKLQPATMQSMEADVAFHVKFNTKTSAMLIEPTIGPEKMNPYFLISICTDIIRAQTQMLFQQAQLIVQGRTVNNGQPETKPLHNYVDPDQTGVCSYCGLSNDTGNHKAKEAVQ